MTREILFRGKRVDTGEWVEGSYLAPDRISWIRYDEERMEFEYPTVKVNPATVGQYTGLTGKNGVKIFEGDKLNIKGIEGSVSFLHGGFCYFDGDAEYTFQTAIGWGNWEITGNIHDK